jgi:hypothetical protein
MNGNTCDEFFSIIQRHVFARPFYCGYVYNMLLLYIDYTTYLHPTCKYIIILEKRDANVSIIPYNMGLVEIFVLKNTSASGHVYDPNFSQFRLFCSAPAGKSIMLYRTIHSEHARPTFSLIKQYYSKSDFWNFKTYLDHIFRCSRFFVPFKDYPVAIQTSVL